MADRGQIDQKINDSIYLKTIKSILLHHQQDFFLYCTGIS